MNELEKARAELRAARRKVYALTPRLREGAALRGRLRRQRVRDSGMCLRCEVAEPKAGRRHCLACLKKINYQRRRKAEARGQ